MTEPVRCPCCDNWLGVVVAGRVESRHRRRRWAIRDGSVECEKCGAEVTIVAGRVVTRELALAR